MATFVLIHGAGGDSWYWHLVVPELRARGHEVVAVDLPCEDDSAGLTEYADAVVEAIGDRTDLVLVAQSMAGFTAPLVCERMPVDLMVLLAAMVPAPGESPGDWWDNTGWEQARREQNQRNGRDPGAEVDVIADFLHDVPPDVGADAMARGERRQSGTPFEKPWPLAAWPDVPTRVLICRDDRFFPAGFMRRVARERLGITPDEMDGGHVPALSRPRDLVDRLVAYRSEWERAAG
jgi:pimeloyl-ACP methyl ester carboxylesterase